MKHHLFTALKWIPLAGLLMASAAKASDGLGSEFSHFAGNAVIASATTVVGAWGAAAGAGATHQWYIQPKLETNRNETAAGLMATHKF